MLALIRKNDFTILITLYFFLLPIGKTLWYPLLIMALIGAVIFFKEFQSNEGLHHGTKWMITGGAFVFIPATISIIDSVDLSRTLLFLASYPLFFLAGFFVYKRVSQLSSIYPAVVNICLIVLLWGGMAIWQYLDPNNPFGPGGSHNQGIHTRDNPFVDGGLMMGVILGSLLAFLCFAIWQRGFYFSSILFGLFITVLIFISGTRSAWLSTIVTIATLPIIAIIRGYLPNKNGWAIIGAVGLLVTLTGHQLYQLPGLNQKINQTLIFFKNPTEDTLEETLSGRVEIWKDAVHLGIQYPLFGTGVNNFRFAQPLVADPENSNWVKDYSDRSDVHPLKGAAHTHQIFLEAFSGAGIPGLLGLIGFFIFLSKQSIRVVKGGSIITLGAIVALWAGFFPLNTHNNFYGGWMNAWFWVWMGLVAGLSFKEENRITEEDPH